MAKYFLQRIDKVVAAKGKAHWQSVLDIEFGGMNDVSVTWSRGWLVLWFTRQRYPEACPATSCHVLPGHVPPVQPYP